ncbi:Hpt domain-containing protein [Candidatus Roizmanbacteria bacterium]|nr:Hpt domain-containing protein [Candidatus Roizmanbacteria bacterium]
MTNVDISSYKNLFVESAREFIYLMKKNLQILNIDQQKKEAVYEMFRGAHSLKSQSYAMDYMKTAEFCTVLEDYFHEINDKKRLYSNNLNNVILDAISNIEQSVNQINQNNIELDLSENTDKLKKILTEVNN